ncbi:MAG: FHA domain-containing protein [Candidatus Hydrogenedens sp.]|nr:FHA domain-containing protein [Candidatus Hydrogenedens sp.]
MMEINTPFLGGERRDDGHRGLCLRLLDGPLAGSGWPLANVPILIGRGMGCQIRLDDTRISRHQCEVFLEGGCVMVRHLSTTTQTCLNGAACGVAAIALGDVLGIGDFHIMVDTLSPVEQAGNGDDTADGVSRTPRGGLRKRAAGALEGSAATQDSGWLHELLPLLPEAASVDHMADALTRVVCRELGAAACWFVRNLGTAGQFVFHPPSTQEEMRAAPLGLLRDACESGELRFHDFAEDTGWCLLAAPMFSNKKLFGAIAVKLPKPLDTDLLRQRVLSVARYATPLLAAVERFDRAGNGRQGGQVRIEPGTCGFVGAGEETCLLRERIRRAAQARANVLITGETGVGKDIAARALHDNSIRAEGPFITVNCAALPGELFESEMFGHERGAFTGATSRRIGLLEQAHGGTLFLDEVGDLSLPNQARLLRAVDTGSFRRVGARAELQVDARIVSATNRTLPDATQAYFRHDLYHRLAPIAIQLSPLRDRKDDIPLLAQHFLDMFWADAPARPRSFSGEAMHALCAYDWPGNVRELRNVVERACFEARENVIAESDLGFVRIGNTSGEAPAMKPLDELEREHLIATLERCGWKVAEAARALEVSRGTVYYKLSKLGIDVKRRTGDTPQ